MMFNYNKPRVITTYYYTLEEAIKAVNAWNDYKDNYNLAVAGDGVFNKVIINTFDITDDSVLADSVLVDPIVNTLWTSYLVPKWRDWAIIVSPGEELSQSYLKAAFANWLNRFTSICQNGYPKYKKLINLYEQEEANLMKSINSSSTSKYNDTPQAADSGFEGDNYVSNIATTSTSTDGTTPMARLAEIRTEWTNLYEEWANQFEGLFIRSATIYEG